jgi:hypothetical protein
MLTKKGTGEKNMLQTLDDTLYNIIALRGYEKIKREEVNSENAYRFNRIMEIMEQIAPWPSPISNRELSRIFLLGNTTHDFMIDIITKLKRKY